jgi:hypothetical protein
LLSTPDCLGHRRRGCPRNPTTRQSLPQLRSPNPR